MVRLPPMLPGVIAYGAWFGGAWALTIVWSGCRADDTAARLLVLATGVVALAGFIVTRSRRTPPPPRVARALVVLAALAGASPAWLGLAPADLYMAPGAPFFWFALAGLPLFGIGLVAAVATSWRSWRTVLAYAERALVAVAIVHALVASTLPMQALFWLGLQPVDDTFTVGEATFLEQREAAGGYPNSGSGFLHVSDRDAFPPFNLGTCGYMGGGWWWYTTE